VSYTRGTDLSGSFEGAGGIGGLLGRSHGYHSGTGNWNTHNYYHADGAGNVTYLVNSSQTLAASYRYDPFGNLLGSSGTLAAANVYRFSSKEVHLNSGLYAYGYRFYSPNWQRWVNQDPLGELGGLNLYDHLENDPVNGIDPEGLKNGYRNENDPPWTLSAPVTVSPGQFLQLTPPGQPPQFVFIPPKIASVNGPTDSTYFRPWIDPDPFTVMAIAIAVNVALMFLPGAQEAALPRLKGSLELIGCAKAAKTGTQLELDFVRNLENPNFVLYKASEFDPSMLRPGEYTLNIPYLRNQALDWEQNQQALERAMNIGNPIREANPNALGGGLQQERDFMSSQGWQRTSQGNGVFWTKPSGQ